MKFKFTLKVVVAVIAITLLSNVSFAQKRSFIIGSLNNVCSATVKVPVYTTGFVNVLDFQFSIDWDTTVLTYKSVVVSTNPSLGITSGDYNGTRKGFGFLWYDQTVNGITVPDSTLLFTLTFVYKAGAPAGFVPIYFGNTPTAIGSVDTTDGAGNSIGQALDTALTSGYLSAASGVPVITANGPVLTASTVSGCAVPNAYQWYTVSCTGPCGPGAPVTYTAIPGATSATYTYNYTPKTYAVVVTYAGGVKDTSASALPVKLLNFKGKNMNNSNLLSWVTTTEINTSEFAIERSSNGETYTQIATVKAAGISTSEKAYDYSDNSFTSFANYYRLKMIDENGAYTYSNVVRLNKQGKAVFQIQPNPVINSTVNVYGNNMKFAKIYDVNGKLLLNQTITNADQAQFKLNNLAKGVYMINVTSADGQTQTEKFIVK